MGSFSASFKQNDPTSNSQQSPRRPVVATFAEQAAGTEDRGGDGHSAVFTACRRTQSNVQ